MSPRDEFGLVGAEAKAKQSTYQQLPDDEEDVADFLKNFDYDRLAKRINQRIFIILLTFGIIFAGSALGFAIWWAGKLENLRTVIWATPLLVMGVLMIIGSFSKPYGKADDPDTFNIGVGKILFDFRGGNFAAIGFLLFGILFLIAVGIYVAFIFWPAMEFLGQKMPNDGHGCDPKSRGNIYRTLCGINPECPQIIGAEVWPNPYDFSQGSFNADNEYSRARGPCECRTKTSAPEDTGDDVFRAVAPLNQTAPFCYSERRFSNDEWNAQNPAPAAPNDAEEGQFASWECSVMGCPRLSSKKNRKTGLLEISGELKHWKNSLVWAYLLIPMAVLPGIWIVCIFVMVLFAFRMDPGEKRAIKEIKNAQTSQGFGINFKQLSGVGEPMQPARRKKARASWGQKKLNGAKGYHLVPSK